MAAKQLSLLKMFDKGKTYKLFDVTDFIPTEWADEHFRIATAMEAQLEHGESFDTNKQYLYCKKSIAFSATGVSY